MKYGIFADTVQKTGQNNDFTVFLCARTDGQNVYIIDVMRAKLEAPDLIDAAKAFWKQHKPHRITRPARCLGFLLKTKQAARDLFRRFAVRRQSLLFL